MMKDIEAADICHAIEVATDDELGRLWKLINALPYSSLVKIAIVDNRRKTEESSKDKASK